MSPWGTRLNKIRWLNQNNEESFFNLAMISYIEAEVMRLVFENYHEAFISWTPTYNDLQQYEIEISLECKFYFPPNVGCDKTEEIALVKKMIYDDIVVNKVETVYDPDSFREFCISAGATKLFETILDSVTGSWHSTDHIHLNKKRVVSFIYNLSYCLSRTCNTLQMDHAFYLKSNLINQEGIETEHIMGHTCSRRTLNNVMHKKSVLFQIFWRFYNHSYRSQMANSANNWWFYSHSHKKKATSQSSILSIVPTIGPLHIFLNSRKHIVHSYHPFFKTEYETIFPRSK